MKRQENAIDNYSTHQFIDTKQSSTATQVSMPKTSRSKLLEKTTHAAKLKLASDELRQEATGFRQQLEAYSEREHIKIEDLDKHLFKGFLSYINRLYTTGKISEEDYAALIAQAASSYAERLVESKITKALEKYELYLEKAGFPPFL